MKRVIIDTDMGIDDAHAVLMALLSTEIQIEGFTTVFGNTNVEYCTRNVLYALDLVGKPKIPVYQGASSALMSGDWNDGKMVHGEEGLGDLIIPEPNGRPAEGNAIRWLVDTVLDSPTEIEVLALGPLTNIALATLIEPKWVDAVKRIIFMGGIISGPGNVRPLSTANIFNDAEAAKIVFHGGYPIVMVGQDVTRHALLSPEYKGRLRKADTPVTRFLDSVTKFYEDFYVRRDPTLKNYGVPLHDMLVIGYLLRPSLFRTERLYVTVETEGHITRGQTVPDRRPVPDCRPQIDVCVEVDVEKLFGFYLQTISAKHAAG